METEKSVCLNGEGRGQYWDRDKNGNDILLYDYACTHPFCPEHSDFEGCPVGVCRHGEGCEDLWEGQREVNDTGLEHWGILVAENVEEEYR